MCVYIYIYITIYIYIYIYMYIHNTCLEDVIVLDVGGCLSRGIE